MIDEFQQDKIWVYNSGIEHNWQASHNGIRKVNNLKEQKILNRQAELLFYISDVNDTVFIVKDSDPEFLKDIEEFGIKKPNTILVPDLDLPISRIILDDESVMTKLKLNYKNRDLLYVPYILSKEDEEICKRCGIQIYGSSSDTVQSLNNKAFARRIVNELGLPCIDGIICDSKEKLENGYNKLKLLGYNKFVLKEPYNSAGKGVFFIKDEKQFYNFWRMMRFDKSNNNFEVIIEGWIDEKRDINYQIEISKDGAVKLIALTEQIISVTAYKGSLFPAEITDKQTEYYNDCAQIIGKKLYEMGFTGIIGIDSIISRNGIIYPAIEFNARLNQSTFYIPFLNYFNKKNRRVLIRSYDIKTNNTLEYTQLKKTLINNRLLYNSKEELGIIILNSSCLSIYKDEDGKYESRLYLANVYKDYDNYHFAQLDQLLKQID